LTAFSATVRIVRTYLESNLQRFSFPSCPTGIPYKPSVPFVNSTQPDWYAYTTMTTPKLTRASKPSYLLLAVKILLVLVILFLLPKLVTGGRQSRVRAQRKEVELRSTRILCEKDICSAFIPEESMNCIFLCVSPACYEKTYGIHPLEDGEIDIPRAKEFEQCVKEEFRALRKRNRVGVQ
jgi:hypothetical protein